MSNKAIRSAMFAGLLVFMIICYIALGLLIGASAREMIPPWHTLVFGIVGFAVIFIGGWYMPEQRRKRVFRLDGLATILLFFGFWYFGTKYLFIWYVPALAISAIIIISVGLFWPTKKNNSAT